MKPSRVAVFAISAIVLSVLTDLAFASKGMYSRAVVESCRGCQLNRLPDVKAFILEDVPLYDNAEFKHIQGAPPELVLYDHAEKEIERLQIGLLTREECNELMYEKGFKKSKPIKDEI
ncbi:selenoprotein M-like [Nasonia vitripennis]|uniref:Selenoprotein M n=1 Tax=Nasonia vitripennis TaxID=7425 RepID=A0A7M7G361_NASVI|nr:selenoprotein M-like [Nasonia vitripennis]